MKKYNIIFSDLDGTLISTISGETFPKGIGDMKIRFEVLDKIKKVKPEYLLIVTNQGGIESGFVDEHNFRSKLDYVAKAIHEYCDCECYAMYCDTNDKSDPYRKPNIEMLKYLTEHRVGDDFDYIKSVSLMIGDASGKEGQFSDSDKKTAENFGIDYIDVEDFKTDINTITHYKSRFVSVKDALPEQDEEVIVLVDDLNNSPNYKIAFGHIVDKERFKDYNGWNIPNVVYWFSMPKLPKE